ncbi:hypothetical protein AB9E06_13855 [Rhizobium leguminosarum]|uniref:hypothetical protein n=1 Tax=Rhizobium leguminosarum TaxID=384 RepID=UPI0021B14B5B|nr:hypothetical protein [Rhizobium leguminosarum]
MYISKDGTRLMKLTIFDCDGVPWNSEEIYLSAELEYLESIGAAFEPKPTCSHSWGFLQARMAKRAERPPANRVS